jgi:hypothetical protein
VFSVPRDGWPCIQILENEQLKNQKEKAMNLDFIGFARNATITEPELVTRSLILSEFKDSKESLQLTKAASGICFVHRMLFH